MRSSTPTEQFASSASSNSPDMASQTKRNCNSFLHQLSIWKIKLLAHVWGFDADKRPCLSRFRGIHLLKVCEKLNTGLIPFVTSLEFCHNWPDILLFFPFIVGETAVLSSTELI